MSRSEPPVTAEDSRPQPPREPAPEECCNRGCEPCVFDRYYDALERYHDRLQVWLERHPEATSNGPTGSAGKSM